MSKKAKKRKKKAVKQSAKKANYSAKRKRKKAKQNNSDAARLYRFVKRQVKKMLPDMLPENRKTLVMMIIGLVRSGDGRLSKMAEKVCYHHKIPSLVDRFRRFIRNENIDVTVEYGPFAQEIFQALQDEEKIVLMIDSTKMGGNCICLMVSVYYGGRALPLAWTVFKGRKGHSSQERQLELLKRVKEMLPLKASVVLVADGEFDGSKVVAWFQAQPSWLYVCRTSQSNKVFYQGQWVALNELKLEEEQEAFFPDLTFTESNQIPKVNILVIWHQGHQEHWFFVCNAENLAEAKRWYTKRFTIETLFSDLKGRGFNLDNTRLWIPERVSRLVFVAALAYYFIIVLGVNAFINRDYERLVRTDACYHSLFSIGLIYLNYLLNQYREFPSFQSLPPPTLYFPQTVPL